jgi:glycosyltransferase involved in cell wall biosynthesis
MVSVVIPAYNEEKLIASCLDFLAAQQTSEPFEVIIVNNNSTDRTQQIAESYKNKLRLKIVRENKKGRGAARRAGFAAASGEIILSTDADTLVPKDWIEKMTRGLRKSHADAYAATGTLRDVSFFIRILFLIGQSLFLSVSRMIYGYYWLIGFNFAIYRSAYERTKGFDSDINVNEDCLLTKEVHKTGKIAFTNEVPVFISARRYRNGFLRGGWVYLTIFLLQFILHKKISIFPDMR